MENKDYSHLKIGFAKMKVVAISPDLEWVNENYDDSIEEINYIFEPKGRSGNKRVRLDIFMVNVKENIFKYSIFLEDEEISAASGASLFINEVGDYQWCKTEEQLFDSFKFYENIEWVNGKPAKKEILGKKSYHKALKGELELVNFLKVFKNINPKNTEDTVFVNLEKLFNNDFSYLQKLINDDRDFHLVALAVVENSKQKVWKEFLSLKLMPEINNNLQISKYSKRKWDKFIDGLSYCKGIYKLEKLRELRNEDIPKKQEIEEDDSNY